MLLPAGPANPVIINNATAARKEILRAEGPGVEYRRLMVDPSPLIRHRQRGRVRLQPHSGRGGPIGKNTHKRRGHQNDESAVAIGYFAAERQPGPERRSSHKSFGW